MRSLAIAAVVAVAAASPRPYVAPTPVPLQFSPAPAASFSLEARSLGVSPDGVARVLVRVRFAGPSGEPTRIVNGGDVEFSASRGSVVWQPRLRFDGPSAIVATRRAGPLAIVATVRDPRALGRRRIVVDPLPPSVASIVAGADGPHDVAIGWFPADPAPKRILRIDAAGRVTALVLPCFGHSSVHDASVRPGARYRYRIERGGRVATALVGVPPEPAGGTSAAYRGKGVWLAYSPRPRDDDSFARLDPALVVRRAKDAGLSYVEVRVLYGEFDEIRPAAKAAVDALIDGLHDAGIAPIAWTVPRRPTFAEVAATTRLLAYRTAAGNGFAGLAVDLERGDDFMGARDARAGIVAFARALRRALGPGYAFVATVEDPWVEQLSAATYPYRAIARTTPILQPMVYWRAVARDASVAGLRVAIERSAALVRRAAGIRVEVNVGAQTAALGPLGAPPPEEIRASILAAKGAGAVGISFYDYFGTDDGQWSAIGATPW